MGQWAGPGPARARWPGLWWGWRERRERRAGDTPDACPLPAGAFRSLLTGEPGLKLVGRWIYGCWLLAVHPASAGLRAEGPMPAPGPLLTGCWASNGFGIRRRSGGDWAGLPQLQERLQWAWGWAWCLGSATGPGSGTRASRRQPAARPSGLGPCRCWAGPKRKGARGDCGSPRVKQPPAPRAPFFTPDTPVSPLFGGVFSRGKRVSVSCGTLRNTCEKFPCTPKDAGKKFCC